MFFGNYLDFVTSMMMKVRMRDPASGIDFNQVRQSLGLFSTQMQKTQEKLVKFVEDLQTAVRAPCKKCGAISDRDARFCPSCGTAMA